MSASEGLIKAIKLDLNRTDPGNIIFQREQNNPLFNVLVAYANFDPECNYC